MRAIDQLKRDEGFRATPYQDTEGVWTFGYGTTSLTKEEAHDILAGRVWTIHTKLWEKYSWYKDLNEARRAVIINMVYNLGFRGFAGFKKTVGYLKRGKILEASQEMMDSQWASQVKGRAKRLQKQLRTGEWV